jgi:3-methyladenine DNA glycosylase AlkD
MISPLRSALEAAASPTEAAAMAAYMKGHFPFLGVKKPARAAIFKPWLKKHAPKTATELYTLARELWAQPEREFQYCAMEAVDRYPNLWTPELLPLCQAWINDNPWWDSVDLIASHFVGGLFQKFPELRAPAIARWRTGTMWEVRTCIIFQLRYGHDTDTALLTSLIEQHCRSKEFFIQKAIGWALRDYSYQNPKWVWDFVDTHTLAPLSTREAVKAILRTK